jgi:hypothetical protein
MRPAAGYNPGRETTREHGRTHRQPALSGQHRARDVDGDGIGSLCDADFDQNCMVQFQDLGALKAGFYGSDPNLDMNGNAQADFEDLGHLAQGFFQPPGPSGVPNACSD